MEPISKNDLVYVYRGCKHCNSEEYIGYTFKVLDIITRSSWMTCCEKEVYGDTALHEEGNDAGFMTYGLRRIPPLDELEEKDITMDKPVETIPSC